MKPRLPPIYPITDKRLSGRTSHLEIVRELIRGGASLLQIRDHETPVRELLCDIRRCVDYAAGYDVRVVVNDRCDLARIAGAGGVHLGQEDLPAEAARIFLGSGMWLGVSTHCAAQVRQANLLPVDYVGYGPVFATATKSDAAPPTGLARLRRTCHLSSHPVVAIGGIGLEHIGPVLEAGAASAAVIGTLMTAKNIASRMQQLLEAAARRHTSSPQA